MEVRWPAPPLSEEAAPDGALTATDLRRYARQIVLPEVGAEGQRRLKTARVLIVGTGGLGSPAALYLAAAGVGTLGLVDFDRVEESNLHRQLLYGPADVGRPKLEAAADRLRQVNPDVRIETREEPFSAGNGLEIVQRFDVVLDGTDNFPARYLVNDACVLAGLPNVYASVFRFEGQASVFWKGRGPCYRCVHPSPPPAGSVPSCAEGGVLGVLPGVLGLIQATEAIKLVTGTGRLLLGRLLLVDLLGMDFREIALSRDPDCAICGDRPTRTRLEAEPDAACDTTPVVGSSAVRAAVPEITPEELQARRGRGERLVLLDVREPHEYGISDLPESVKIPLGTLPRSYERLSPSDDIVVYCRVGGRSANAVQFLQQKGYGKAVNLAGGINSWAERIDPSLPRY